MRDDEIRVGMGVDGRGGEKGYERRAGEGAENKQVGELS